MDVEYPDECFGAECRDNKGCQFCLEQSEMYYIETAVVAQVLEYTIDGMQEWNQHRIRMVPEFCPFCGSRMKESYGRKV